MTAYHHYDLLCDHPGCEARYSGGPNATIARDSAAQDGWRSWCVARQNRIGPAKSGDSCPEHAADLPDGAVVTPVAILRSA